MIDIKEFTEKVEAILNDDSSGSGRPSFSYDGLPVYFSVRTPSLPYFDDATGKNVASGSRVFPVSVENASPGSFEAFPDVGLWNMSLSMTFLFPVECHNDMMGMFAYLASKVVGKIIDFGSASGFACCTLGTPSLGQMRYLQANEFSAVLAGTKAIFGSKQDVTREWSSLQCEFYLSSANGMNESGGIIYGNQISVSMICPSLNSGASEKLLLVSPSDAKNGNTYEQQNLSDSFQKGTEQNSAYSTDLTVFVQMDAFGIDLMKAVFNKTMNGKECTLVKTVSWDGNSFSSSSVTLLVKDVALSFPPGKPVTCTFLLEPKA